MPARPAHWYREKTHERCLEEEESAVYRINEECRVFSYVDTDTMKPETRDQNQGTDVCVCVCVWSPGQNLYCMRQLVHISTTSALQSPVKVNSAHIPK
jgi:hypothetical protein